MKYAAAILLVFACMAGCGGASDRSAAIAEATGASSCSGSSYQIVDKLDSSKARIYDCWIGGSERCVTEQDGIDRDVTAEAKLLFSQELAGGAPDCAT